MVGDHPVNRDKARRPREQVEEAEESIIRQAEEHGELRHLHGRPLDLSDDSPAWFANRVLKQEGYSHPLLQRGRDVDEVRAEADAIVKSLRSSRRRFEQPGRVYTAEQAQAFNRRRTAVLEEYRAALQGVNRAVLFYNLAVPETLHRRPVLVDDEVSRLASEIPPVPEPGGDMPRPGRTGFWQRFLRGR